MLRSRIISQVLLCILAAVLVFTGQVSSQFIRNTVTCSPDVPGGNAGSLYARSVHSTGLVYNVMNGFGGTIGVYDPSSHSIVAEVPQSQANGYTGGTTSFGRVNQTTNLVYFLINSNIVVVDGRPASPTFNQTLPTLVFPNQTVQMFTIDQTRHRMYVNTLQSNQARILTVDLDPASPTFHQVLATAVFPPGLTNQTIEVNIASNKIYSTTTGAVADVGVYVMAGGSSTLTKIAGTLAAGSLVINEASNTVYAARSNASSVHAINGATDTLTTDISLQAGVQGTFNRGFAINPTTERIYAALGNNNMSVIDAKSSNPTFNTVLVTFPLGAIPIEITIASAQNKLVATFNSPRSDIIDLATNTAVSQVFVAGGSFSGHINPLTNKAFVTYQLGNIVEIDLTNNSWVPYNTACEITQAIVNPNNGKIFIGINEEYSEIAAFDANDNISNITGLPHEFGRYTSGTINKTTNRLFFMNSSSNLAGNAAFNGFVAVVDGNTNSVVANVEVGRQPFGVPVVNEVTNKFYVMNVGFGGSSSISVIDGATNTASFVDTSAYPAGTTFTGQMAMNTNANKIYHGSSVALGVINGATNISTPIPGGPAGVIWIAANSPLNRFYFLTANSLRVYSGVTDTEIANIPLSSASQMVVNETNGRIYVRSFANKTLTAIDGNTNTIISTLPLAHTPVSMGIDQTRNRLYLGNLEVPGDETTASISFINGDTLAVKRTLPIGLIPNQIAVNPVTRNVYVTTTNAIRRSGGVFITDFDSAPFDYDGDGKTDPSVWRPSDGTWYVSRSGLGDMYVMPWGLAGDNIVPADYDGDGKTDLAVRRPGDNNFYIFNSSNSTMEVRNFGITGDVALPSDYNGDGKADVAVWRPSDGTWYLSLSGSGIFYVMPWGLNGDKPVPGDFDGDGKTDLAVFRPAEGRWYIFNTVTGAFSTNDFGINGDQPVQADYSGDGKTDFAVYRPSNNTWYRQHTNDGTFNVSQWGLPGDFPVPGDFDGDGKTDVAVWRPSEGTWYVLKSTSGVFTQSFGTSGDIPTPNAFVY